MSTTPAGYRDFATWADVMAFARAPSPTGANRLYYWAPLDARPVLLRDYQVRARTLRIFPPGSRGRGRARTSDPFIADAKHLSRFLTEDT